MFRLYSLSFAFLLTVPLAAAETHRLNWETKIEGADSIAALTTDASGNLYATGAPDTALPLINSIRRSNSGTDIAISDDGGASWKALANLPNGHIGAVAAVPSSPGTFLMGASDGVYKSTDNGATWSKIFSGAPFGVPVGMVVEAVFGLSPSTQVGSIVFDPTDPKIVYLCSQAFGVMKSTDGGAHWGLMNTGFPIDSSAMAHISYLAIDPFHPRTLIAGLGSKAYRSDDGAQSWQAIDLQVPNGSSRSSDYPLVAFDPKRENVVYSFAWFSLYRSTDRGATWAKLPVPGSSVNVAAPDPVTAGTIYASSELGVFKSTDDGATWTSIGPPETAWGDMVWSITIDPSNASHILISNSAASWHTANGGQSWTRMTLSRRVYAFAFGTGSRVVATAARSTDIYLFARNAAGDTTLSCLFGGQGNDEALALAADAAGNLYVAGKTTSADLITTENSAQRAYGGGGGDGFVAKIAPNGVPLWTTYLGGAGADRAQSIAVTPDGSVAVAGITTSPDFAPLDSVAPTGVEQVFVARISADGARMLSVRRMGGAGFQSLGGIALDSSANVWVAGMTYSGDLPVTADAIKSSLTGFTDGFLARFAPDGATLYSTYLGGSEWDKAAGVAVDSLGNVYVVGNTRSSDFPTTNGAYQRELCSNCPYPASCVATGIIGTVCSYVNDDIFTMKLSPDGKQVLWSTLVGGGCYEEALAVAVAGDASVYVLGNSNSSPFPVKYPIESGPSYSAYKPVILRLDPSGGALRFASNIGVGSAQAVVSDGVWFVGGAGGTVSQLVPADPPPIALETIQNMFRLTGGPVAPGELLRLSVPDLRPTQAKDYYLNPAAPLPIEAGQTRVLFDGRAVPLKAVTDGAAEVVAPFSLTPGNTVTVQVESAGARSNTVRAPVVSYDLGMLSADGSGRGQAFAQNADGSMNSPDHPASAGDVITVFFTGAGSTTPASLEGSTAPNPAPDVAASIMVTIGWLGVSAQETREIPGFLTGLAYARVKVPNLGYSSPSVPVKIAVWNASGIGSTVSQELTLSLR